MNNITDEIKSEDEVVVVTLPAKDYQLLRELIGERRALIWMKKWFQTGVIFIIGGTIASIFGLWETLKEFFK